MSVSAEWPIAVRTVDVAGRLRPLEDVDGFPKTRIFVFDAGMLIGSVDVDNARGPISATRLRDAIGEGLTHQLIRRAVERRIAAADVAPPLDPSIPVSIVIPTCGRPDDLRRCLDAVTAQRTERRVEVIVVDNRPSPGSPTRAIAGAFRDVVLLEEARPGLSYARNAGFVAATGSIAIAIDDDVVVPEGWLERLLVPFARAEIMAVTGHVLPIELHTQSQCRFEAYGGLGKGFTSFEVGGAWFRSQRGAVPT